jgi:hypothetical protein
MYFAIGLDEDPDTTLRNGELLNDLILQIQAQVDGSPDISNNATFKLVQNEVVADQTSLLALVALAGCVNTAFPSPP